MRFCRSPCSEGASPRFSETYFPYRFLSARWVGGSVFGRAAGSSGDRCDGSQKLGDALEIHDRLVGVGLQFSFGLCRAARYRSGIFSRHPRGVGDASLVSGGALRDIADAQVLPEVSAALSADEREEGPRLVLTTIAGERRAQLVLGAQLGTV